MKKSRRALILLFAFILAVTALILPMSAAEYKTGDMNGDGRVNSDDAIYLLRHTLSPAQYPLACNHNLIQHEANAPTCTEKGYNAYETCSRCGQTTYEELEALGHNYENYKCSRCGETYTSDIPYSEGLEFKSNGNGTASVIGIGTCKDPVIVIPDMSPSGDMITAIDKEAFLDCISIKSVLIPDSVTSIGNRAFFGCYGLAEVINKSSLNIIKGSSNNGYVSYYALEVHSGESKIVNNDGYLFSTFSEDDNANTAKITNDGIIFINADGSAKTVVIGDGPIYQFDTHTSNQSAVIGNSDATLNDYSEKIFGTEIGDKFYLTYNVSASDFDGIENGKIFSFISWKNSVNVDGENQVNWWHLLRIHNDNGVYRVVLGTGNNETRAVMELNKNYNFVFEFEYTSNDTESGRKTAEFSAYMDGKFIGASSIVFEQSDRPNKTIRINGGLGTVTYTDFKLFKPEKEVISEIAKTADDGIIFTNPNGTYRVVTIGNGAKYELNSREVSGAACLDGNAANTLNSYNGSIFGTEIGDKFFLTYNVNVSDFGSIADGATSSFTSWKTTSSSNDTTWGHLVRLKNDNGVYRVVIGESTQTEAVMELNETYNFVFEFTYNDSSSGKKTATFRAYMDGEYIGNSSIVFAQDGRPNNTIRLNGTSGLKATFTNIKLFKPEKDDLVDIAITTNEGIIFVNADGSTETVTIGNGPNLSNAGPLSLTGSKKLNTQLGINLEDYKGEGKIFLTGMGDKFYLTFNVSVKDITLGEGSPQSFISWMYGPNDYSHLIRLQNVNGEYKVLLGNGDISTSAVMNTGEEYSFIFAFEYTEDKNSSSYTSKIATCKVYMDGVYIGETPVTIVRTDKEGNNIRLNTTQIGGTATYTDFKFFKPEKDEFKSASVANYLLGYVGNDTKLVLPQSYDGNTYQISNYAFYDCDSVTKVWIPGAVTSIGDYSFYDCDGLTDVIVNGSEISIGNDAFGECDSFTNITYKVDAAIIVKEDTYVVNNDGDGDKSGYTFSTEPELNVKTNGESMTRYTYLKFDISSLAGDDNFTCIDLDLMQTRRESDTPEFCAVDVYACDPSINVDELTFNNQPTEKAFVTANNKIDSENVIRSFSITDYVRFALSKGQSEIVLCLKDSTPGYPHRVRFASLESGKNAPKLSVYYGTKVDDQKFIDGGVFGDPQISENGLDAILGQHNIANMMIPVSEDAYTEAGASSNVNFGTSEILSFKGNYEQPTQYYRVVLLKFNVEEIPTDYKGSVNLALYCNYREAEIPNVHVYACDSN